MRTRHPASLDVSSCVWMPGNAKESNALIGSMWPGVGRQWLPTWLPLVDGMAADLSDRSATRKRVAATTGITLSDEDVGENARSAAVLVAKPDRRRCGFRRT
jgi:hypothetical protein